MIIDYRIVKRVRKNEFSNEEIDYFIDQKHEYWWLFFDIWKPYKKHYRLSHTSHIQYFDSIEKVKEKVKEKIKELQITNARTTVTKTIIEFGKNIDNYLEQK